MDLVEFIVVGGEVEPRIKLTRSATILDLKKEIKKQLSLNGVRQTLMFNGRELRNDHPISHYKFEQSTTIVLIVTALANRPKVNVIVTSPEGVVHIKTRETDSVLKLMKRIHKRLRKPLEYMTLYRCSKKMEKDFLLSKYYVCEGCELNLVIRYPYEYLNFP